MAFDGDVNGAHQEVPPADALAALAADDGAAHLRAVMDFLPVGVLLLRGDPLDQAVLFARNAAAEAILGGPVPPGTPFAELPFLCTLPESDMPRPLAELPLLRAMAREVNTDPQELQLLRPDGEWQSVLANAAPVLRDGKVTGTVVTLEDVTERRTSQARAGFQAAILEQVSDAVVAINEQQRITYWGGGAEQLYGLRASEALGRPLEEVYRFRWPRPEDEAAAYAALSETGIWRGENIHVLPNGEERRVESTVSVLRDGGGQPTGLLAVIRDVTERRASQEALWEANERLRSQAEDLTVANEELQVQAEELHLQAEELRRSEDALRASESRARHQLAEIEAIYHFAGVGLCVFDTDLRYVRINERLAEINGVPAEAHLGKTPAEVVPDLAEGAESLLRRILETGEPALDVEFRGTTRAQPGVERIWVEQWVPVKDAEGRVVGVNVVAAEVTEQRRAEEALRASEERYHSLFDTMGEGLVVGEMIYDEDGRACDYRFIEANPAYEHLTGMPREESLHKTIKELIPTLEDEWIERHARVAETGGPARWESYNAHTGGTYDIHTYRPAPGLFASIFTNITERRRMEEALRASEEKYRIVADFTYDWEYWCAPDGRDIYMSPSCERITGYTREEFMADPGLFTRIVHPEDRDHADVNAPAHQVARVHELEFRIVTRSGETRWIHHYCVPIIDEAGTRLGRRASNRDVTDRRQMEDALRLTDRRKDEFLAMLAHELRNPLAAVSNAVQLMKTRGLDDPVLERARDAAERQTRHMTRLLDDLLDVSRVTEGKITLKREEADLASVVLSAVETIHPLVEEHRHELSVSLPPEPVQVNGDPVRLAQVAANLLGNAAKYTPSGGSISVSLRRESDEAVIRVRDNGIGISREVLPHVFDLFVQEDTSLGRERGGLGIGLTMVRALVDLHGGRVEARSEGPGHGSEFIVALPFQQAEHGGQGSAAAGLPSKTASPCAMERVLVVDDNADGAEILAMTLEAEGHEAITAHDGPSAIRLATEKRPDVVLLDIGMPGMDGYEVARRLRQEMGPSCPVLVALTGYGQDEDRERAREAGFDHHLVKPARIEVVLQLLAAARSW